MVAGYDLGPKDTNVVQGQRQRNNSELKWQPAIYVAQPFAFGAMLGPR